jgi:3-dehydroquinate synthase
MKIKSFKGEYEVEFLDVLKEIEGDFIVVDRYVYDNYSSLFSEISEGRLHIVESNEGVKTLTGSQELIDKLISSNFRRNNSITAVGGGVVQDLVSFTTSVLYRGVSWIFYPTTLLAQCDSCIGSKTSINYKGYKNLLGGFHPPSKIYICKEFTKSLPESEIKCGMGEMLHYFLLNNKLDLAERMVSDNEIRKNLSEYIQLSLALKKEMVQKDEFDKGERNLFNYGHTFGHAIEKVSDYEINHGQAVTMGMEIANRLSLKMGLIDRDKYDRMKTILEKNMPNYVIEDSGAYVDALKRDKKNTNNQLTCILLTLDYGIKTQVSYEEVKQIIKVTK